MYIYTYIRVRMRVHVLHPRHPLDTFSGTRRGGWGGHISNQGLSWLTPNPIYIYMCVCVYVCILPPPTYTHWTLFSGALGGRPIRIYEYTCPSITRYPYLYRLIYLSICTCVYACMHVYPPPHHLPYTHQSRFVSGARG